jgi:VWFA-related protein
MRGHHVAHGVVLSLFLVPSFFAQNQEISTHPANQTSITVTVTDRDHHPVIALKPENFTVYEDGQQQTISSLVSGDVPACIGMLVDRSGSMRGKHQAIAAAMGDFVRAGNPGNKYFVVLFNDEARLEQDFTGDAALIEQAIAGAEARGGTAFYDSVIATADHLAEASSCQKRVLLLSSDGVDNESRKSLEFTANALKEDGNPLVYAIGLQDRSGNFAARSKRALEALTAPSGGTAIYIGDYGEFRKAAHRIADELRSQYAVTFAAQVKSANPEIKVVVHPSGRKDFNARVNQPRTPKPPAVAAAPPAAAPHGSDCIAGSVVNEDGKPLPGTHVEALPLFRPNPYSPDSYPFSSTDEQGNFKIPGLQSGRYRMFTKRETPAGIHVEPVYQGQDAPFILSSNECANVVIRFPTRFARLKIEVVDPATKARIADYGITLQHTGSFPFAIPHAVADVPILVPAHMELKIYAWKDRYTRSRPVTITTADSEMLQQLTIELDMHPQTAVSQSNDQ